MLEGDGQPWWVETSGEASRERWESQDWFYCQREEFSIVKGKSRLCQGAMRKLGTAWARILESSSQFSEA